ncbi:hypothetical protein O3P69_014017 [Scylla paramamosain]|uniref:Uncharacterized protein n=1 Tax=Scylla paramamosain TaxID=85552 RepID=A0AAW0SQU0_SCYPA
MSERASSFSAPCLGRAAAPSGVVCRTRGSSSQWHKSLWLPSSGAESMGQLPGGAAPFSLLGRATRLTFCHIWTASPAPGLPWCTLGGIRYNILSRSLT